MNRLESQFYNIVPMELREISKYLKELNTEIIALKDEIKELKEKLPKEV